MTLYESSSRKAACALAHQLRYPADSGGWSLPMSIRRHVLSCLTCQADVIRHKQIMKGLAGMSEITEAMPYDLAEALESGKVAIAGIGPVDELALRRRPSRTAIASASIAAIGVAVVAGRRFRSAS